MEIQIPIPILYLLRGPYTRFFSTCLKILSILFIRHNSDKTHMNTQLNVYKDSRSDMVTDSESKILSEGQLNATTPKCLSDTRLSTEEEAGRG